MNIILYNNGGNLAVRYTQPPTEYAEIDTIKIYAQRDINTSQPIAVPTTLRLESIEQSEAGMPIHFVENIPLYYNANTTLEKYVEYSFTFTKCLPAKEYACILVASGKEYKVGSFLLENKAKEKETGILMVQDKTIVALNQEVALVAEDHLSQEITFLIKENYNNFSLLDDSKKVYVDYIPVGYVSPAGQPTFLSDDNLSRSFAYCDEDGNNWLYLKWRVPGMVTQKAGRVPFALAILEANYIWQTQPAILTVYPNIGFRGSELPVVPSDPESDEALSELEERIANIEENYLSMAGVGNEFGIVSSADDGDDEILIGGGSANG